MEFVTISRDLAYRAYSAISFSPDKRADSTVKDFNEGIKSDFDKLSALAISEPQKAVLSIEFERYQIGYKSKYEAYLHAKSRTMSTMITGPANFPVRSNEKKMNTERKRWEEFDFWQGKAMKTIENKVFNARTAEQVATDKADSENKSVEYILKRSINVIAATIGETPYSPALLKGGLERDVMRLAKSNPDLAERAAKEVNLLAHEKMGKDVFTTRHGIWKKLEVLKEQFNAPVEEKEDKELLKLEFVTVINNFDAERVQLLFEEKPSDEVRSILKSSGFRWSPRFTAWQRQNTNNGLHAVNRVIEAIKPLY